MMRSDKNNVRQKFADRFLKSLEDMGYSPYDGKKMKALFGISRQAVSKWINGDAMPSSTRMHKVASVLGVRRAWLQDGEEPMRPTTGKIADIKGRIDIHPGDNFPLSEEEVQLVCVYRQLSQEQRKSLGDIIKLFVKS